jgi:hypothetical protein
MGGGGIVDVISALLNILGGFITHTAESGGVDRNGYALGPPKRTGEFV